MLMKDLVAGWQPDDGRTLFLVGDPMQSIYRFRQAEVGLFLKTQQEGLGEVRTIKPLTISVNFRSQAGVVEWVNRVFNRVMPKQDNLYSGAISYKSSQPFKEDLLAEQSVCYYAHADRQAEGQALLDLIQRIKKERPDESIGVLVRGRKSLADLVMALNDAGVAYQATDIDPLNKRQTVIDLMSLTRASASGGSGCLVIDTSSTLVWFEFKRYARIIRRLPGGEYLGFIAARSETFEAKRSWAAEPATLNQSVKRSLSSSRTLERCRNNSWLVERITRP